MSGRGVGVPRLVFGAIGVLGAAYGAWLLVTRQDPAQWRDAVLWLAGGVVAHDAVLAPVTLGLAWLGARVLPAAWRMPAAVGAVVLGSLTLLAVPVLGRFGARADNPTLLPRDYATAWWVLVAVTVLGVLLAGFVRRGARRRDGGGA